MGRICCVSSCKEDARFKFSSKPELRRYWLIAINRPSFDPKSRAGLCAKHFRDEDFITEGLETGTESQRQRLKAGAIPTLEIDNDSYHTPMKRPRLAENADSPVSPDPEPLQRQESDLAIQVLPDDDSESAVKSGSSDCLDVSSIDVSCVNVSVKSALSDRVDVSCGPDKVQFYSTATQTPHRMAPYTVHDFKNKPNQMQELTGLDYERFLLVVRSLGPDVNVNSIPYKRGRVLSVSLEDQFFITLWKLRKATTDIELGIHFDIDHTVVSNIFNSCIPFMADRWGRLNLWPSRDLVDYYMPTGFKMFPTTRVIVDGTEFPIEKPKNPRAQQATFSSYKNTNTLKALVGGSPSGLISYVSECYGGGVIDRTERSALLDMCDKGDSIMADRGFNVQDIFASRGVAINMPDFLKGRDHLPGTVIIKDRKLASKRVHTERLIGLTKTYKILQRRLQHCYVHMGSELFLVCVMLCIL